jgi:hypothetical protein
LSLILRRIAGRLLASALTLATAAHAQCPAPIATALVERFISADCEACWATGSAPKGAPFVLDWIVPSARGDDAPLSAAELVEATARAGTLPPEGSLQRRHALPARRGLRVGVQHGPAWNGYIALQLHVQREGAALPAGAMGYLALVESVPAGEEGTPVERRLVRVLAGPLTLDNAQKSTKHLVALRIPYGAKVERLGSAGWIQDLSGQVIAVARADTGHCARAK